VRLGELWLRLLLRTFPPTFRAQRGPELLRDALVERRHERFSLPVVGAAAFWWWVTVDILRARARLSRTLPGSPTRPAPRPNRGDTMGSLLHDLRHAVRSLTASPVTSAVIVLTLTVGIGMNTAIFSVVNDVLLQPLQYTAAGELVSIGSERANENHLGVGISGADYRDMQAATESLDAIAAIAVVRQNLTGIELPQQVDVGWVSGNTFSMLGVEPVAGRVFTDADPPGTVLLSYDAWQRWFGGDAAVVGRSIDLDEHPYTVTGVLPADFRLEVPGLPRRLELWKNPDPFSVNGDFWSQRELTFFRLIGRRAPGASVDDVRTELGGFAASLQAQFPDHAERGVEFTVAPLHEVVVGPIRSTILMLSGAVALVMLIVCANITNLLVARAQMRHQEMVVRRALGSSRRRIVQLLLVESGLLAALGGSTGIALGVLGTSVIDRLRPPELDLIEGATVDLNVLGFAVALSLACVFLCGLAPAFGTAAIRESGMGVGSVTESPRGRRFSRFLVAGQIAVSLLLLIAAGLLALSLANLQGADPGFVADNMLTFSISLPSTRYDYPDGTHRFFAMLGRRLEAVPGVVAAGLVWPGPLSDRGWSGPSGVPGRDSDKVQMDYELVTADFFDAAGTRLLEGRSFRPDDPQGVVMINRKLAERAWPGESPLGRIVTAEPWGAPIDFEVIGVVANVRHSSLRRPAEETLYFDSRHWSWADWEVDYVVRTSGDPLALVEPLRNELAKLDAEIPMARPRAMRDVVAEQLAGSRFATSLLALFATVAALLAAVGLYGVMSYAVGSRRREIGIRMALGSDRGRILRLVMGQGFRLTLAGLAAGWTGALWLTGFLSTLLYEVEPVDVRLYLLASALLVAATLLAAYLPARRATRLDPVTVLHSD
jgi:putative ABC transport system permease protein